MSDVSYKNILFGIFPCRCENRRKRATRSVTVKDFANDTRYCGLLCNTDASNPLHECLEMMGTEMTAKLHRTCMIDVEATHTHDLDESNWAACDIIKGVIRKCLIKCFDIDRTWTAVTGCGESAVSYQ